MTEEAPPDIKRRRLSADDSSPGGIRSLIDLPSGILAHAASFLAAPSKVLFAIALDEKDSAVTPNERSSAIVGNQWDVLDFGQMEKELTAKLSDSDIERLLQYIDAVNSVKRLKLANCTKITGVGLEPLRGSTIIEQIDLSLVGENLGPDLDPDPRLSCDHVLPILDSIIEREGCALKYLQFPSVWRKEPSANSEFHAFVGRYNQMRGEREEISCLECNQSLPNNGFKWIETNYDAEGLHYGTHFHTCYGCLKHYCHGCGVDGEKKFMLNECAACKRDYCVDCKDHSEMTFCSNQCGNDFCRDCFKCECVKCNREFCSVCVRDGDNNKTCEYCDKCYCNACYDVSNNILTCRRCNVKCCDDCRFQRYRQGQLHCAECIEDSALLVARGESSARLKQLEEENERLKIENEAMKRKIEEQQLDIEELRSSRLE